MKNDKEEKIKTSSSKHQSKKTDPDNKKPLRLSHIKKILGKVAFALFIALIAFFFIKTAVWEYYYYNEKEGSERAPVVSVDPDAVIEVQEVDEAEVTVEQRIEWTVPADEPRYLSIEKLGIYNARVRSMGLTRDGSLDTPYSIFDVGWYNRSSKPGSGGVLVIDGHNGGPNVHGVFKDLNALYADDLIVIERGDGQKFTYRVVDNKEVPLADANDYMSKAFQTPVQGLESVTLISCVGEWSQAQQTYLSRQFTRAVLVK